MKEKTTATIRVIAGGALVVFGLLGLALPLLQGIFFLIIGLYILSLDSAWFRVRLERLVQKNVWVAAMYQKIDRAVRNFFGMHNENT